MKKIITFLYLLILAYACYDDKGNYDYREINQISIQNIDSLVLCDQMDLLSIPVTLEGTQYSDSNRFTYMWEVNQKVVATTKDLNVYANFPLGINTARFVVTDKELGTKALIVTDRVMTELGNVKILEEVLEREGLQYTVYDGVQNYPLSVWTERGVLLLRIIMKH